MLKSISGNPFNTFVIDEVLSFVNLILSATPIVFCRPSNILLFFPFPYFLLLLPPKITPKSNPSRNVTTEKEYTTCAPVIVYSEGSDQQTRRSYRFEVDPIPFVVWLPEISRRRFRLGNLFNMLRKTRVKGVPCGSMTSKEAIKSMWKYFGGRDMVALTVLRPSVFNKPYAYCHEKVAYVCRINALIYA